MHADDVFESLKKSAETDRLAQAYLMVGRPREDAAPLVIRILKVLFCEGSGGCGECAACRRVEERVHPDILWVEPQKKSRIISIQQIRDLRARVSQTSFTGTWKSSVLMGADRMSDGAANAFLKTLEEPPGRCVFFLLSDSPQGLLPTILSRCQRLVLSGSEIGLTGEYRTALTEILSSNIGHGVLGALVLSEKVEALLKLMKEAAAAEETEDDASGVDVGTDAADARINARYREWRLLLMRSVLLWYRDLLVLAGGGEGAVLHFAECGEALTRLARDLTYTDALRKVDAAADMYHRMEQNLPEGSVLSTGFIGLA